MKLEDLKIGDILIPNGATRNLYTHLADSLDFVCVVVKKYEVLDMLEVVVIYAKDNEWLGQKISSNSKDLACFDRSNLNAAELLKIKKKPLYPKWNGDKVFLGRIGE